MTLLSFLDSPLQLLSLLHQLVGLLALDLRGFHNLISLILCLLILVDNLASLLLHLIRARLY